MHKWLHQLTSKTKTSNIFGNCTYILILLVTNVHCTPNEGVGFFLQTIKSSLQGFKPNKGNNVLLTKEFAIASFTFSVVNQPKPHYASHTVFQLVAGYFF